MNVRRFITVRRIKEKSVTALAQNRWHGRYFNCHSERSRGMSSFFTRRIMQALAATNGNVTAAAKKLGISRRTLHRKINEMNLAKTPGKAADASGSKE